MNQPVPPARDAAYFDQWYADMSLSPAKDAILARGLGLPDHLGSAGVLPWDGVLEVAEVLRIPAGGLLVDLACGRGGYGIEVASRCNARLLGIDFSGVALEQAAAIAAARLSPGNWEFRRGLLTQTDLAEHTADAVMCTDSVQFAEPVLGALKECRRLLVPGGRVAITTWRAATVGDPQVPVRLRRLDLQRDLHEAGFVDVLVEDRPAWRETERRMWEDAMATPNPDDDPALAALHEEGRSSLEHFDSLQRVLATATAP